MTKKQLRKLQLQWYRKLRKAGFRDIEGTSDFNDFPVSTLRSSGGTIHLSWDFTRDDDFGETQLRGWDGQSGLGDSANWEYYGKIKEYAEKSDTHPDTRKVCLAFLDKHPRIAKRSVPGISPARTMKIWNQAIQDLGLPAERHSYPFEAKPKQQPARRLSKKEIASLNYTPPGRLK